MVKLAYCVRLREECSSCSSGPQVIQHCQIFCNQTKSVMILLDCVYCTCCGGGGELGPQGDCHVIPLECQIALECKAGGAYKCDDGLWVS